MTSTLSTFTPLSLNNSLTHVPSSPTAPTRSADAPAFATATAWFAPFPPARLERPCEEIVSPGRTMSFTERGRKNKSHIHKNYDVMEKNWAHSGRTVEEFVNVWNATPQLNQYYYREHKKDGIDSLIEPRIRQREDSDMITTEL